MRPAPARRRHAHARARRRAGRPTAHRARRAHRRALADWRRPDGLTGDRQRGRRPRSLAFNVHGFRVAVDTATGEVRILQSVQAADAGFVMNPEQCRGQIEGGVAQAHRHARCTRS